MVGSWAFSVADSVVSLLIYTLVIALNLTAIEVETTRVIAAGTSAVGHLIIGALHVYRLVYPFNFEVFGYSWSYGASLREALIVLPIGLLSLVVAISIMIEGLRLNRTTQPASLDRHR